jgi:hypothetical protein
MNEDSVSRALGELQGTVRSMADQWRRQDEIANAGRLALYERFESLSMQMLRMSGALDAVTQDVAELRNDVNNEIKPAIDSYRLEAARRLGVLWAGRTMWTFMVGIAGAVGFAAHEMVQFFTRKP